MPFSKPPLILTSDRQTRDVDLPSEQAPRRDYFALARALDDAPITYAPHDSSGLLGSLERRSASDLRQAFAASASRNRYRGFISLSEKVGVPLSMLLGKRSRIPHVLVAHHVTSDRKRSLQIRTGYLNKFTRIVVQSRAQERYLLEEAHVAPQRVKFLYGMVDHLFWTNAQPQRSPLLGPILSVGRERRDYAALAQAARLLPERKFLIVASSPWSTSAVDTSAVPANIEVLRNLSWVELKQLYEEASIVVVPLLLGTMYAAGLNGVLEAMAMSKPIIVTSTPGIADYLDDGNTMRVVTASDPPAMAAAIEELSATREFAAACGDNARTVVEGGRNLDSYVSSLTQIVNEVMPQDA